jgi:PAS domain S-box-containing protein
MEAQTMETQELKQAKAEIKRLTEELEQKVLERTRELAATNEALRSEIAERELVVEARKDAEDRIRLVIDSIPVMAWSLRPDGILDFINQPWLDYVGVSFEEALQEPTGAMQPGDVSRAMEKWLENMAAGESYEEEMRLRRADGKYRWFLIRTVPLRDGRGNIVKWYGTSTDIEDRKRAEQALRESEERFREVAENIDDVVWLTDPEHKEILYISPAYEKIWGRPRDTLFASVRAWTEALHPEDRERIMELRANDHFHEMPDMIYRIIRPDGSLRWIHSREFPVKDVDGRIVRVAGIAEDITERKEAEEKLRRSEGTFKTLFGMVPVGISVLDRQHNIIDANPALEQITRLSKEELLNGAHRRRTYLNPDGTPKSFDQLAIELGVTHNRPINDVETGIVTENGEIVWTQVSVAPLALPDASAVVITQDITERKRAAKELERANSQLRFLSRRLFDVQEEERRHLARELHDEIGQTLTAANINLKIIASNVPAVAAGRLEDSIQLLDRLLLQVGQLSLDLRSPLLDELGLVPALRWLVDEQAQRAGLRMTFTANMDSLEIESAVQTACFRVAQEAITNVIRHAGASSVAIKVWRDADRLWLSVRDDGAGFNPTSPQREAIPSSGLGLVSMKERTLLVRGGLEVRSVPRQGTEIRAWFPLVIPEDAPTTPTP